MASRGTVSRNDGRGQVSRRRIGAALLSVIVAASGSAQARLSAAGRDALDAYLEQTVAAGMPGIVAAVVTADGLVYAGAFGRRDVANDVPLTVDSIFRIASMTKPVTSVALMMLVEAGAVGLDDPVARYLPEYTNKPVFAEFDPVSKRYRERPATREITLRHLLTHTSGLGYAWSDPTLFALVGAADASPSTANYPLLHDPGERWTYGESTRVIGRVIEVVAGEPLEVFLRERLFAPLGMTDTAHAVPEAKRSRVVTAHTRGTGGFLEQPNRSGGFASDVRGDGGLFSTAPDYARFLAMLLNGGRAGDGTVLLRPETVTLMGENHLGDVRVELQTPANSTRSRPFPQGAGADAFGLGFQVTAEAAPYRRAPGSLSWAGIQNTFFWIDPAEGIGAVLLMQYLPFFDPLAIETLEGFEERIYRHLEAKREPRSRP
jgi:methyl acetate hydrolase